MKEVCLDLDNMQKYAIIFIVKKLQMRRRVSSGNRRIKKLFDDMTIEEKAGQLFQTVGAMYDDEAVISGPMQEMGITEKDIQLAGTVLGTMGAEKIKRIQKNIWKLIHTIFHLYLCWILLMGIKQYIQFH